MLKSKKILISLILPISLLSIFLFYYKTSKNTSIPVMATPEATDYLKTDLNGDGKTDIIYIVSKNDKYYLQALINEQTYHFNEQRPFNTLGNYKNYAPLSIHALDLSRDKLPEIIIQAFDNEDTPIQHIYTFRDNSFVDILCSTNNTLGVLNSKNNKTPIYLSFDSKNITDSLSKYMLSKNTPKNISYEKIDLDFFAPISKFIYYLSNNTDLDIYTADTLIQASTHHSFYKYFNSHISKTSTYSLLDIFFKDTKWDKNSNPIEFEFELRFKETLANNEQKELKLIINVSKIDDIFSISKIQ